MKCSNSIEALRIFNDYQIVIDGSYKERVTGINYIINDNIAFVFKNNRKYLDIAIVTSDRNKIMREIPLGEEME